MPSEPKLVPATTLPFSDTAFAVLYGSTSERKPIPLMPPAGVQRKACVPFAPSLSPTTTPPFADTSIAALAAAPPARSPTPVKLGTWACAAAVPSRTAANAGVRRRSRLLADDRDAFVEER